jgi:hypothetical protein
MYTPLPLRLPHTKISHSTRVLVCGTAVSFAISLIPEIWCVGLFLIWSKQAAEAALLAHAEVSTYLLYFGPCPAARILHDKGLVAHPVARRRKTTQFKEAVAKLRAKSHGCCCGRSSRTSVPIKDIKNIATNICC